MEVGVINIDFDIFSHKPNQLIVGDNSEWVYSENLPSYILITLPGSRKQKEFIFKKKALNRFNSHNLGLSCLKGNCEEEEYVNLPDGIYTICVKSGYEDIMETKFFLKTDIFKQELSKVLIKSDLEYSEKNKDFLTEILYTKSFLSVAEAHAYEGDFVKAQRFFEEAKNKLKKMVECKNCI